MKEILTRGCNPSPLNLPRPPTANHTPNSSHIPLSPKSSTSFGCTELFQGRKSEQRDFYIRVPL